MNYVKKIGLAQIADGREAEWFREANEELHPLMEFFEDKIGRNLHEMFKAQGDLELFQAMKFWLFAENRALLNDGLEKFNFSVEQFEQGMLTSTVLSVTKERKNLDFILEVMMRNEIVDDLEVGGRVFTLKTRDRKIDFSKADEYFDYKNRTVEGILNAVDLVGGCHMVAEKMFESNPEYKIMTTICRKNLVENYYHSVVLIPGEKVVDLTENLVIGKEEFCKLYNVQEVVILNHEEYEEMKDETKDLDESKTLYVPLRVAIYEWRKNGKI